MPFRTAMSSFMMRAQVRLRALSFGIRRRNRNTSPGKPDFPSRTLNQLPENSSRSFCANQTERLSDCATCRLFNECGLIRRATRHLMACGCWASFHSRRPRIANQANTIAHLCNNKHHQLQEEPRWTRRLPRVCGCESDERRLHYESQDVRDEQCHFSQGL